MADDPVLAARVRAVLPGTADLVERRMFGGIGFLVGGVLRVGVGRHPDHVMMARIPVPMEAESLATAGVHPAIMRGRPISGWLFFEEAAVATDEQLRHWVLAALDVEV